MKVKLHHYPSEDVVCETAHAQIASSVDKVSVMSPYPIAFHHCWHFCLWPLLLAVVRLWSALACSLTKLWL